MKLNILIACVFLFDICLAQNVKNTEINRVQRMNVHNGIIHVEKADTIYIVKLVPNYRNPPLYLIGFKQFKDSTGEWQTIYTVSLPPNLSSLPISLDAKIDHPVNTNSACIFFTCGIGTSTGQSYCDSTHFRFSGSITCSRDFLNIFFISKTQIKATIEGIEENKITNSY